MLVIVPEVCCCIYCDGRHVCAKYHDVPLYILLYSPDKHTHRVGFCSRNVRIVLFDVSSVLTH